MKFNKEFIINLIRVGLSNLFILTSQVLVGLALPKIMSINDFGLYRKFMLYATYISLLHFGFTDGILIKYGGAKYSDINKSELRTIIRFFILLELTLGICISIFSLFCFHGSYRTIFFTLGIYCFLLNSVTFYQFFSQAVFNFKILSFLNEIQGILISSIIVFLIGIHLYSRDDINYTDYIYLFLVVYLIIFISYLFYYKKLMVGNHYRFAKVKDKVINIFKIGILITVAYQLANITLNFDNQLVSIFFDNKEFAIYSFAYNLVSIIISVVMAISTVLFPYLSKQGKSKTILQYSRNNDLMLIFVYGLLVFYYFVNFVIKFYLPNYITSLVYFRVLLPGVAITTSITSIIFNHYKVTNDVKTYFINGCYVFLLTIVLNIVSYNLFHSIYSLAIVSLITLLLWYSIEDIYFRKKYKITEYRHYIYIVCMTLVFETITKFLSNFWGAVAYIAVYLIFTLIIYSRLLNSLRKCRGRF